MLPGSRRLPVLLGTALFLAGLAVGVHVSASPALLTVTPGGCVEIRGGRLVDLGTGRTVGDPGACVWINGSEVDVALDVGGRVLTIPIEGLGPGTYYVYPDGRVSEEWLDDPVEMLALATSMAGFGLIVVAITRN